MDSILSLWRDDGRLRMSFSLILAEPQKRIDVAAEHFAVGHEDGGAKDGA